MPVAKMMANPRITILNIFWYTSSLSTLITAHAKTKKVLMNDEVWTPTVGLVIVDEPRLETQSPRDDVSTSAPGPSRHTFPLLHPGVPKDWGACN